MDDPLDDENALVRLTSLGVLGVGLAALFLGYDWFWVAFVIGFAVVVPVVKTMTDQFGLGTETDRDSTDRPRSAERDSSRTPARADAPESKRDALDVLRDRYARGELSETEFERKVERLLETETLEGARDHVGRESADSDSATSGDAIPGDAIPDDATEADRATERR